MRRTPPDAWQRLCIKTARLCQAAYDSAMRNEPHSEFPGVDIDAIHRKMKFNPEAARRRNDHHRH